MILAGKRLNVGVGSADGADLGTFAGYFYRMTGINSGTLAKMGGGAWTLTGNSNQTISGVYLPFNGSLYLDGGTLVFNSLNNFGTSTVDFYQGTLKWASSCTADISGRLQVVGPSGGTPRTVTLNTNGNNVTLHSPIAVGGTGEVNLHKTGAGMLTTNAANTFGGKLYIDEGKFAVNTANGTLNCDVQVAADCRLDFSKSNDYTFSKIISGAGGLAQSNSALTLTALNTYSGNTLVQNSGTLKLSGNGTILSSVVELMDNCVLDASATTRTEAGVRGLKSDYTTSELKLPTSANSKFNMGAAEYNGYIATPDMEYKGKISSNNTLLVELPSQTKWKFSGNHTGSGTMSISVGTVELNANWNGNLTIDSYFDESTLKVTGSRTVAGVFTCYWANMLFDLTAGASSLAVTGGMAYVGTTNGTITVKVNNQGTYNLITAPGVNASRHTLASTGAWTGGQLQVSGNTLQLAPSTATVTAVNVTPATATVQKGSTQQFSATVTGTGNPPAGVNWTITGANNAGTTISSAGLLSIAAAETATSITVKATSTFDNTKFGTATVTVTNTAVTPEVQSVSVAPNTANVQKGNTQQFNATVTVVGGASQSVNWTITGANNAGTTISNAGLLSIAAAETATSITVKATSTFDNTKFGTATVTVTNTAVTPEVMSVTVTPSYIALNAGETYDFDAIVTAAGGASESVNWVVSGNTRTNTTIDQNGVLSVDVSEPSAALSVLAISTFDNTKIGTADITVTAISGIEELQLVGVNVYPNPFIDFIKIDNAQNATVTVIDLLGKTHNILHNISNAEIINLNTISSGIYLLHISKEGKMTKVKVVKR